MRILDNIQNNFFLHKLKKPIWKTMLGRKHLFWWYIMYKNSQKIREVSSKVNKRAQKN